MQESWDCIARLPSPNAFPCESAGQPALRTPAGGARHRVIVNPEMIALKSLKTL